MINFRKRLEQNSEFCTTFGVWPKSPIVKLFYFKTIDSDLGEEVQPNESAILLLADPKKESKIILYSPTESATGPTELKWRRSLQVDLKFFYYRSANRKGVQGEISISDNESWTIDKKQGLFLTFQKCYPKMIKSGI